MIDPEFKVQRVVAVYCNSTDEFIREHALARFDLPAFQDAFGETNPSDPMFDCYAIAEAHIEFLSAYLDREIHWDFDKHAYFVEAFGV